MIRHKILCFFGYHKPDHNGIYGKDVKRAKNIQYQCKYCNCWIIERKKSNSKK